MNIFFIHSELYYEKIKESTKIYLQNNTNLGP